jgi:predicted component of type VI protein secretion system
MKLIRNLEELIEDEIHDVKKYAKMAAELKAEHPGLAQVLYTISTQEDSHQSALHNEVVKIIDEYKRTKGEPPAAMMAVYDFMHKRHIEDMAEARRYQDIYKSR